MNRRKIFTFLCVSLAIAGPALSSNLAGADPAPVKYPDAGTKVKLRSTTNAQRAEAAKRAAARRAAAARDAAQRDMATPPQTEGGTK